MGLYAQNLDLFEIMKGEDFVGYWPENLYWAPTSDVIYFRWNPDKEQSMSWYAYSLKDNKIHKLSRDELKNRIPQSYNFSPDRAMVTYSKNGDIYLLRLKDHKTEQITETKEYEFNPTFTVTGKKIIFQSGNNLFAYDIKSKKTLQLTYLKAPTVEDTLTFQEQSKWLCNENSKFFDVVKKNPRYGDNLDALPQSLALSSSIRNLQLSPDQRFITYTAVIYQALLTAVPHYITADGQVKIQTSRAKVGFVNVKSTFYIYDRQKDTTYQLNISSINGIKDWPQPYKGHFHGLRSLTYSQIKWSDDGKYALMITRSQDNKDRWILLVNLATGTPQVIDRQTDTAWIGGPGISDWYAGGGNWGWVPGKDIAWFQSERTGYSHLYTYNVKTGQKKQLTHGRFEIYNVYPTKKYWYLVSNKIEPGQRQLYRMPMGGGKMQIITHHIGNNQVFFSPDYKHIALRYSNSITPWEIYLKPNNVKSIARRITHSTTKAYESYHWRKPQIITFVDRDGDTVHARLFLPADSVKNSAAVLFVHGAGYLQDAHRWWSYYYREHMFHNLLADKGFTVMDIDYRGSEGYGRYWRTAIYRHMGGKDLEDLVDGAHFLVKKYGIDPKRIGIYGGSYGGFLTLMAMFKDGDVFCCGAAIRSVTNWANYNNGYTANILNLPTIDPQAYRQSSPIYFAQGLKGRLLILHGMIDDNVHYQDVVQLTERLIELHKTNWDITPYPVERHDFKHAYSWQDEYRRIYDLFMQQMVQPKFNYIPPIEKKSPQK